MRKVNLIILGFLSVLVISCQKEIDWSTPGGSGGGGMDGDLLVKAQQITPATHDTNYVTFQYDANKRLVQYKSAGKVNGTATDILIGMSRAADGRLLKLKSQSSLTVGLLDSVVYYVHYTGATNKLAYVVDTQYTILGAIPDSAIYTYNASGQVSTKRTFTDFLFGYAESGKETYDYDTDGNIISVKSYSPDGAGGYDLSATTNNTFDNHKASLTLGEECFIVIGATSFSRKNLVKVVTNAVASGTTYTNVFGSATFNSFDRPKTATLSVLPQPPGYENKLTYYYQ